MHVALVTQHYWPFDSGGSGLSVRELAEGLVRRGDRVTVIAQSPAADDFGREREGVEIRYLAYGNRFHLPTASDANVMLRGLRQLYPEAHPGMVSRLQSELFSVAPDIVHTHVLAGVSTRIWRAARELGVPVVHTLRDYYLTCVRGTRIRRRRRCTRTCTECRLLTLRRKADTALIDAVVGVSDFVLDRHLSLGYFKDTAIREVIPNGISPTRIADDACVSNPASDVLCAGYIGRMHPSKGLEVFLHALRALRGQRVRGRVAIAGGDRAAAAVRHMGKDLDLEVHSDADADVFLRQLDVLVVPSLFEEPFGRVLLEANAQGVPVICSRRGGAQALVSHDETGWLFEPEVRAELPAILGKLAEHGIDAAVRRRCIAFARRFDLAHTIEAHRESYAALATRSV